MKLIVAGSRSISVVRLEAFDIQRLVYLFGLPRPSEIISGGCTSGADAWIENNWSGILKIFKADWLKNGKAAGPIRNAEMAEYGDVLLLIWDGESKGSSSMKEQMVKRNKPVYEIVIKETK